VTGKTSRILSLLGLSLAAACGSHPGGSAVVPDAATGGTGGLVMPPPPSDGNGGEGGAAADAAPSPADSVPPAPPAPPPPAAGAFSNPAAVKLPSFPDRTCPVSAGAGTAAINAAIASCNMMGGGVVTFAPGTYTVTSLHLQSNVKLSLGGATIRGTGNTDAAEPYTTAIACQDEGHRHWHNALIWGENVTNVAIVGPGTLDGGGLDTNNQKMIALKSSSVMLFEDLNQSSTGHFGYLLTDCHHITLAKITMRPSRDGVDLMECTDVNAHDISITGGGDDAFALKNDCALGKPLITDNVTVSNATLGSGANALQIGSETWGDFQNISWSHIKVVRGGKSGIGIQMNDGSVIRNMSYDDIQMTSTSFPIVISTTSLLRGPTKVPGHAENIRISNVSASNLIAGNNKSPQETAIIISGDGAHPHQGIVLEHVAVAYPGGGSRTSDPPEVAALNSGAQWNPRYLTPVPAYGLFIRHARNVELRDVKLTTGAPDQRPAVIARDVDSLLLDTFTAQKGTGPSLELETVKNLTIHASAPLPEGTTPSVAKTTY
jgi:hypothetical protein